MGLNKYISEFRYNFQLAYPIILGMMGHTLVGIIDNIMVGKLGPTELAAASLANSFVFVAMSLGIGFSTAITPLVAEATGEKNTENGRNAFQHGLVLCTILGIALFLMLFVSKPLIGFMKQPEDVVELAKPFLDIVAFSMIPLVMFQAYKQFADGMSETKYAMWATFIGNAMNVLVNYLLIYGIWIFPKMGMLGAAMGTLVSRIVMLVFMHIILTNKKKFKIYFSNFSFKGLKREMMEKIISLGFPSSMQMLFEVVLFTAAIWLSGIIGTTSQAANQVALSLASMTFMFAMGLSVAGTIRVGNYKGKNDYQMLQTVAKSVVLLTVMVQFLFGVIFIVFNQYFPTLFVDMNSQIDFASNQELIKIASQLLIVAAIFQISDGVQVVVLGALRGLQDVKIPMYITFFAYWVVGFPISVYLGIFTPLKAVGIWIGLLAGLTTAAGMLYMRFSYKTKKLILEYHTSKKEI